MSWIPRTLLLAAALAAPAYGQHRGAKVTRPDSLEDYVQNATLESGIDEIQAQTPSDFEVLSPRSLKTPEQDELHDRMLGIYSGQRARSTPDEVGPQYSPAPRKPTDEQASLAPPASHESLVRFGSLACLVGLFVFAMVRRSMDRVRPARSNS